MERSYIRGIIYSIHDERQGPWPHAWTPASLPGKLREKVAWEMTNEFTNDKIMKPLVVFPLPEFKMKMLVKHFNYIAPDLRGGRCTTTLAALFDEQDDMIFYQYMRDFEELFDKYARAINAIQESNGDKSEIQQKVTDFNTDLENLIHALSSNEQAQDSTEAFPEARMEPDASVGTRFGFKVIVCGDATVGKTSLILRWIRKAFKRSYMQTLGFVLSEKSVVIGDQQADFQIWDVAGQTKFNPFRKQFYAGAHGALLVYDITNPASFHDINGWYKDITSAVGNITGIIIGNKKDLESQRAVSVEELEQLGAELGLAFFETSALSGEKVDDAFVKLAEMLLNK